MPEVLPDHAPRPTAVIGWDGTRYRVFAVDAAGRLQVRGEDQLFSFASVLANSRSAVISGADGFVDSHPVPPGQIWRVTNVQAFDSTSPTTLHIHLLNHDAAVYGIDEIAAAFATNASSYYHGQVWLDQADTIQVYFTGGLIGDTCFVRLTGYIMTLET